MQPLRALLLSFLVFGAGCATQSKQVSISPLDAISSSMRSATDKVSSNLVCVTRSRIERQRSSRSKEKNEEFVGMVVSDQGHVLLPVRLDAADMPELVVLVGNDEYKAEFVSYDRQLRMSIIQMLTENPPPPLFLEARDDPEVGQWFSVLSPSGEGTGYQPRVALAIVGAKVPARYSELVIDNIGLVLPGAPLLDGEGRVAAIMTSSMMASGLVPEFVEDLDTFISESMAGDAADSDEDRAPLGACLQSINKVHAKLMKKSESALWVEHVLDDSSADSAGLKLGDLVLGVNGSPLRFSGSAARNDFYWRLNPIVGEKFSITVERDGKKIVCKGVFKKAPDTDSFESMELGLVVREIDENSFVHKHLATREGVLVADVVAGRPAATSNRMGEPLVRKSDVIVAVGGVPTPDVESFREAVSRIREEQPHAVLVEYRRGRMSGFAGLNLNVGRANNGEEK